MASYSAGTHILKKADLKKNWVLIDAKDIVLGRLSAEVAKMLRGKHKANYSENLDNGDNIVIINSKEVALTGKKREDEVFYWHTGHPGGVKERTLGERLDSRFPERVVIKAVERMMPKDSPLARKQMKALHVYGGAEHPHEAQQPVALDLAAKNKKNKRS
ncbi:MAG: 50S ribosomal protein L13 [Rickettsiales bacterium]